jgi:hypothetical protein
VTTTRVVVTAVKSGACGFEVRRIAFSRAVALTMGCSG